MSKSNVGEFLGHPKGLFLLFGTEMWERMSYYGLRGILVWLFFIIKSIINIVIILF